MPDDRMDLHLLELFGRKAAGLRDDVRRESWSFPMSCKREAAGRASISSGATLRSFPTSYRVDEHSLKMVVRRLIFGSGIASAGRQRFDGVHVQVGHFFHLGFSSDSPRKR